MWEISENSFSTQTNSSGYSRGLAEWTAHQLRAQGIEAEVREHIEPPPFKEILGRRCVGIPYFQVWAKTPPIGYKQFQHRPCLPLRDFVQFMWRRSLNPRVYNPHIPHGFEEKAGLNFYGEDVAPKVKK